MRHALPPPPSPPPKPPRVGYTSALLMYVSAPLDFWAHVWGTCLQWFGDLVTCDYWGELWLNEGFATYFENYGATAARPEYRFFDTFYATQASLGQIVDAKNVSTHPLATITGVYLQPFAAAGHCMHPWFVQSCMYLVVHFFSC